MSTLVWLKDAGERYLERIRTGDLVFLVELEINSEETTDVLEQLGRCRALPWESWAHACVAVAAVQVAYEAPGGERSFTRLFMKRLNQPYSQSVWEEQYGKRIEVLLQKYFPDDFRGYGSFRYVGPLYRHAGVPAIALPRFAQFLRRLISECGPAFSRQEFEWARQRVSGVASRFLSSEYGFQYARNAARILHSIDIGLIRPAELASIPGYRREFWSEVISVIGQSQAPRHSGSRKDYEDPVLALAEEEARLVLRFDPAAIKVNAVRLEGRPVLYSEVPVSGESAPRIDIQNRPFRFDRWWSPGESTAALFRGSDGRFVASDGGVPAGEYLLVAQDTVEPGSELAPDELGYLADSEYRIWRVVLEPETEVRGCNIYATGSKPAPQIQFGRSRRHNFGAHVFEGRLPELLLQNWDDENARRFWIFIEDGAGPRRLEIEPGAKRTHVTALCPATGAIWIEPRGFFRQASALPRLPFTLLPTGITVEFAPQCSWIEDTIFAQIVVPEGWSVACRYSKTESGMWRIPPRQRVLDGALVRNDVRIPFSVRVPRLGLYLHPPDRIWWADTVDATRKFHIEGTPGLSCSLCLRDDRGCEELSGEMRITQNGLVELRAVQVKDALALSGAAGGEFALRISREQLLATGWHYASGKRLRERIQGLPDVSPIFNLPRFGQVLKSVRDMHDHALANLDCAPIKEDTPIRQWLAEWAVCSAAFDGTQLTEDVSEWVGEQVTRVCDWYREATSIDAGEASAGMLATLPSEDALPLGRWRAQFRAVVQRLDRQSDVGGLVTSWRDAVRRKDGSADGESLALRPGGGHLTLGAHKYLVAMQNCRGSSRMKALNYAIGNLQRAWEPVSCPIVRAVAARLLALAYKHSGRSDQITDEVRGGYQQAGIIAENCSPWEGDYGTDLTSTGAVASNCAATERR
jgi:hypothetical protein